MTQEINKNDREHDTAEEQVIAEKTKEVKDAISAYKKHIGPIKLTDEYPIRQFVKMGIFLSNIKQTFPHLVKLNKLLEEAAQERGAISPDKDGYSKLAEYIKGEKYSPQRKILREVLETELAKFGFHRHFPKAMDFLPPTVFREMLRNGLMPKDPGADNDSGSSTAHGEFSHAIQWLMIAWQHENDQFLNDSKKSENQTVVSFFKELGEEERFLPRKYDKDMRAVSETDMRMFAPGLIWDLIFDKAPRQTQSRDDFRSPENLNDFLLKNKEKELSFLVSLITSRAEKRKNSDKKSETDEKYKEIYPNKKYTLISLPNLFLPTKLTGLDHLMLKKKDIKELKPIHPALPTRTTADQLIKKADSHLQREKFSDASKFYCQARDLLLNNKTKDYDRLQKVYYQIAICSEESDINAAEENMQNALFCNQNRPPSKDKEDFTLAIKNELGKYQHILRVDKYLEDRIVLSKI